VKIEPEMRGWSICKDGDPPSDKQGSQAAPPSSPEC
jgi:hypothetical protein